MDKIEYNKKLKELNLSKKELASILGVAHQTVNNWGSTQNIPYWLKTWLENYKAKQDIKNIATTVKPYIEE